MYLSPDLIPRAFPEENLATISRPASVWQRFGARLRSFATVPESKKEIREDFVDVADPTPEAHPPEWAARLTAEKEFLLELIRGIETEFLATGGGLMDLAQQLGEIRPECEALTDLTLGRTNDAGVQFAFQLLKKAEDLVLASSEQCSHVFTTFDELRQRLLALSRQRAKLMRILLPLTHITRGLSHRSEPSPARRPAFLPDPGREYQSHGS